MTAARFRAGIVGAGAISRYHVESVQALDGVELVGICDLDQDKARAVAEEHGTRAFDSLAALVEAGANVIHVLTPPSAHAAVAIEALEHGCHVLVEKPLTESVEDARRIGALASERGLVASVDHALLFDPQVERVLAKVRAGAIGDVVGVNVVRSSEYPPYEGGPLPPHYRDAGYPWRDLGVHCLYLIQELLGPIEDVDADWMSLGGDPNLAFDEWRALVHCERGLGQFQLSWNAKPMQSELVVHGTAGVLRADLFAMYLSKRSATPLPKAAERVVNAYAESLQPMVDTPVGVWRFLRREVQAFQGLRNLVADFYARLERGEPPAVSIEDATTIVEWTEGVARAAETDHARRLADFEPSPRADFLVTGASGRLGSAVVRRLLADGHSVRVLVRRVPDAPIEGVDYRFGNLGDPDAVERAVEGVERVVHAGAATAGGWLEQYGSSVVGTRNVIASCRRHGIAQLVYISSLSVVDWASADGAAPIDEATPLEPRAEERGAYTRAKLEAEREVSAAAAEGLPCVILRPGLIYGGGIPLMGGSVARSAGGRWLVLGDGQLPLPLVHMDDVVEAVVASIERDLTGGELIQLVDPEQPSQDEVLALAGADRPVTRLPRGLVFALGKLSEYPFKPLGMQSPLAEYRLRSALSRVRFESRNAERLLGWRPRVRVRDEARQL